MGIKRYITRAGAVCCVLALGVAAAPAASAHGSGHGHGSPGKARVLAEGLSSPKGVATTADGEVVVAQGAFGPPGPVLVFPQSGPDRGSSFPVTDPVSLVDVAISPKDGTGWGIGPGEEEHVFLYHQLADGTIETVLDITAYQASDPDPSDQEGIPGESNPYGLTVDRKGNAYIADAANNDVLKVTPSGHPTTVARFDVEEVKTNHLPPEMGAFPPTLTTEAVPTSVTIGPDGAVYVGELKGFPFRPGSSRVWRIDPHAKGGVLCSVNTPSRGCKTYAKGLTSIQDIAFSPKTHRLFVLELAKDGALAFEAGFETGEFPPAVLLAIGRHGRTELAKGKLSQPGGIAFSRSGKLYATDGVFTNGRLLRIG